MQYAIRFKPRALKDGKKIPKQELTYIFEKIKALENDLSGDVKHLTDFYPEYRLRVGNYRILFEVEGEDVVIYRIRHRKDIYR
ncbi:MAG: type II toxin-antitoxin system RelE/ParE family toxin [Anaerolineales bacterium]|nr:type II toxin-antitoxin system RelE/ParE family toxin [Anaerolineales bacterium]